MISLSKLIVKYLGITLHMHALLYSAARMQLALPEGKSILHKFAAQVQLISFRYLNRNREHNSCPPATRQDKLGRSQNQNINAHILCII